VITYHLRRTSLAALALAPVLLGSGLSAASPVLPDARAPHVTVEQCGNGVAAVTVTPAPGFNPLTASAARLEANNFAPRPTDPADLADWVSYATGHVDRKSSCSDLRPTALRPPMNAPNAPNAEVPAAASHHKSPNWAGNVAVNHAYTNARAWWHIPRAHDIGDAVHRFSSQWVGLGSGDSKSAPLIQAGSEANTTGTGSNNYGIWWEVYPYNASQLNRTEVWGDHIYVRVQQSRGVARIHLVDTTAKFDHTYTYKRSTIPSTSPQAEWIHERSEVSDFTGSQIPELTKTDPVKFTSAYASGSVRSTSVGHLPHYYDTMHMYTTATSCVFGRQLAHPGATSSDGTYFSVYYDYHGLNDRSYC
jgi:hypothetical protein